MNRDIYALEDCVEDNSPSIFLAGPTPRDCSSASWRPEVIQKLRDLKYEGDIFIPEKRGDYLSYEYGSHTEWEVKHLNKATVILFWIPRNLETMPAFTTNIEFGEFMHSGKIVLGYPEWADKMRYLKIRADMHSIPVYHTIEDTAKYAIDKSEFLHLNIVNYKGVNVLALTERQFNNL